MKFTQHVLAMNIDRLSSAITLRELLYDILFPIENVIPNLLTRVGDIERSVFRLQVEQLKSIIDEHNTEKAQLCIERITEKKGDKLTTTYCSAIKYYSRDVIIF